jgi:mono/diheme cytochrome c family protein
VTVSNVMTMRTMPVLAVLWFAGGLMSPSWADERGMPMMQPRVPADKLAEARALTSPLPESDEVVERGKTLYGGKGGCVNCHGAGGGGDGPVASSLDPSPRNFQHHGFWRHRTEGEIFWVIKHGSPQTSMIGFEGTLSDEEIWAIIQYERSFAAGHGPRHGMGPRGGMGRMGPPEGMGRRGMIQD